MFLLPDLMTTALTTKKKAKPYKLSKEEKMRMASKINYFRTMPNQVLHSAANLGASGRVIDRNFTNHKEKSVCVGGRILVLNVSN